MTSFDVRFAGDRLVLDSEDNVNLDEVRRVRLVGRIAPQNGP
jgi:hypothetical protein